MSFLDLKYISIISVFLKNFKRIKKDLFLFSCPFCGDIGKHGNIRTHAYIYLKESNFRFYCHKCNKSIFLKTFIKEINLELYREYCLEKIKNNENEVVSYERKNNVLQQKNINYIHEFNIPSINSLPENHYCKQYVIKRKIPFFFYDKLYYCNNFKEFYKSLNIEEEEKKEYYNDKRLIIPFYDYNKSIFMLQGRLVSGNSNLRYVSVKLQKDKQKIYGLERWNKLKFTTIVEGPIDSMFVNNSLAMAGSDIDFNSDFMKKLDKNKTCFVFDNEPENSNIVGKMKNILKMGFLLFVWPDFCSKINDINDFYIRGYSNFDNLLQNNIFHGINGELRILKYLKKI